MLYKIKGPVFANILLKPDSYFYGENPNVMTQRDLEKEIAELKNRFPAHSLKPPMIQQLEDLEEKLENAKKIPAINAEPIKVRITVTVVKVFMPHPPLHFGSSYHAQRYGAQNH